MFRRKRSVSVLLFLFITVYAPCVSAAHLHPEKFYQFSWCSEHNGKLEVVLPDQTRIDCETNTHAVEVEFARKWPESIGQALYYGLQTGKKPGIVLILEKEQEMRYWIRLNTTIQRFHLPIDTWKIDRKG